MDNESIVGAIIMCVTCFGCAALFFGLGVWAMNLEKPMHFWSGSTIDPKTVVDIPEYNRKNAVMWKWYSVPYWLAGISGLLSWNDERWMYVSVALLVLSCVPGFVVLVGCYKRIEMQHIKKKP